MLSLSMPSPNDEMTSRVPVLREALKNDDVGIAKVLLKLGADVFFEAGLERLLSAIGRIEFSVMRKTPSTSR